MFCKSSRLALINVVMKYLNFWSSGPKLKSIPSQVLFEGFHYNCRRAILKNASRWLLLGSTLFYRYSGIAASQRQLQRYIYLGNSRLHIFYISYFGVMLRGTNFYGFFYVNVSAKSVTIQN